VDGSKGKAAYAACLFESCFARTGLVATMLHVGWRPPPRRGVTTEPTWPLSSFLCEHEIIHPDTHGRINIDGPVKECRDCRFAEARGRGDTT
jgi:hypothetical protein